MAEWRIAAGGASSSLHLDNSLFELFEKYEAYFGGAENASKSTWDVLIGTLDSFRDTLDDLGGGLGVTDPFSGPVVLPLK